MTLVILTAGIDLSVGAVMALCAVAAADLMMNHGSAHVLDDLVGPRSGHARRNVSMG